MFIVELRTYKPVQTYDDRHLPRPNESKLFVWLRSCQIFLQHISTIDLV